MALAPTRGERNNNPGNIKKGPIEWAGEADGFDPTFETFTSPVMGIRAIAKIILTYYQKHGLNTIRGMIGRWAPPEDRNPTDAYVNYVAMKIRQDCDSTIHNPDTIIVGMTPTLLEAIVYAIIKFENGRVAYERQLIADAVALALEGGTTHGVSSKS